MHPYANDTTTQLYFHFNGIIAILYNHLQKISSHNLSF